MVEGLLNVILILLILLNSTKSISSTVFESPDLCEIFPSSRLNIHILYEMVLPEAPTNPFFVITAGMGISVISVESLLAPYNLSF